MQVMEKHVGMKHMFKGSVIRMMEMKLEVMCVQRPLGGGGAHAIGSLSTGKLTGDR